MTEDDDLIPCALFRRTDNRPCRWLDVEPVKGERGVLGELWGLPLCSYHKKRLGEWEAQLRSNIRHEAERTIREELEAEYFEREHGHLFAERQVIQYADDLGLYERGSCTYVSRRQGWVKIGRTIELKNRLAALRKGHAAMPVGMLHWEPLYLVAVFPGDIEKELHERWSKNRVRGTEWFSPGWEMSEWLDELEDSEVRHVTA